MIYQTQLESQIFEITSPRLEVMGYEVARIKILSASGIGKVLQIMIERIDENAVTVTDCEKVSKYLSVLFDVEKVIDENYSLELSSTGLDKPLTRLKDYQRCKGKIIELILKVPINGRKKFRGKLNTVENDFIEIELSSDSSSTKINFDLILEAYLDYFAKVH